MNPGPDPWQPGGRRGPHEPLVPALAGVCGAVLMTAALGPALVHPTNIDWLMRGDFSLHFLGWHLYRAGPWAWPLGATPLLIWPVGSSVGLTDSIPLAAAFFKLLDPLLPPVFQFIGIWLVACFALQGVFGALLMQVVTPRPWLQLLGALVFILSPPLIFRFGHAALSAHWLVLAALWLAVQPGAGVPSAKRATAWAGLGLLAATVQPYILLMVMVIMGAAHLQQVVTVPRATPRIALHVTGVVTVSWLGLWQAGSFIVPAEAGRTMGGFGAYSANVLTFIMPTEGTTFFSPGPIPYASRLQYEGYAYLGAGTIALGWFVLAAALARQRLSALPASWRTHLPLALALLFLAAMAWGPEVTAGRWTLFTYDGQWWGPLLAFRTNGRMIWPLYYGVVLAILYGATRYRHRTAVALLSGTVLAQAADLSGMVGYVGDVGRFGYRDPLNQPAWHRTADTYQRLVLIPSNLCDRDGFVDYLPFALLAGQHGLAINAGSTARYDVRRAAEYCAALEEEGRRGLGEPGTLYVVRADLLPQLAPAAAARGTRCERRDGVGVCYGPVR